MATVPLNIAPGSTSVTVYGSIYTIADGLVAAGLGYSDVGVWLYARPTESSGVGVTAEIATDSQAFTSGGLIESSPGLYRFDIPDGAFAAGAKVAAVYWIDNPGAPTYISDLFLINLSADVNSLSGAAMRRVAAR